MIASSGGSGGSMRDVLFRLRLESDPANKKAADEAINHANRIQAAMKQTQTTADQAAKSEAASLRERAAAFMGAMQRQKQYAAEDARIKREAEQANERLAKSTRDWLRGEVDSINKAAKARQDAATEAERLAERTSAAQSRASAAASRANWQLFDSLAGRGGVLHGLTMVGTGLEHYAIGQGAAHKSLREFLKALEELRGIEQILHGGLMAVHGLAKAWMAFACGGEGRWR